MPNPSDSGYILKAEPNKETNANETCTVYYNDSGIIWASSDKQTALVMKCQNQNKSRNIKRPSEFQTAFLMVWLYKDISLNRAKISNFDLMRSQF